MRTRESPPALARACEARESAIGYGDRSSNMLRCRWTVAGPFALARARHLLRGVPRRYCGQGAVVQVDARIARDLSPQRSWPRSPADCYRSGSAIRLAESAASCRSPPSIESSTRSRLRFGVGSTAAKCPLALGDATLVRTSRTELCDDAA